jgi:hypothetical protein|nr:MAG TPA: protein of unknown function (DUF4969) [Caudoviricetes sp.]
MMKKFIVILSLLLIGIIFYIFIGILSICKVQPIPMLV